MKKKNSGFTASGLSRSAIRSGDIYRDTRRGGRVVIRHVTPNTTYRREAYEYDCATRAVSLSVILFWWKTNNWRW